MATTTMSQPTDLNTSTITKPLNEQQTTTANSTSNTNTIDEGFSNTEAVISNNSKTTTTTAATTSNGFQQNSNKNSPNKNSSTHSNSNNTNTNSNSNNILNNSSSNNFGFTNGSSSNQRGFQKRSSTLPPGEIDGYMDNYLDAWLEQCLKDANNAQLSSSSEFLDFSPMNQTNKNNHLIQQRAQHLKYQQMNQMNSNYPFSQFLGQQKPSFLQTPFGPNTARQPNNTNNHNNKSEKFSQQQATAPFFGMNSSTAPTTTPAAGGSSGGGGGGSNGGGANRCGFLGSSPFPNVPFYQGFQSSMMPNYMKYTTTPAFNNRYSFNFPTSGAYFPQNNGSQDFTSLPPLVNMMGGTNVESSEHDINSTEVLDGSASNTNINQGFRFSDPCLLNPSDEDDSKLSDPKNAFKMNHMNFENNKFFAALMEQINLLHETNTKICKNLHETKVDIEALKNAPNWVGMRHRRDSLSGLSTQSQPMMFGGGFNSQSPAPTYHSVGTYAPGMVSEMVKEVKDAARVREDALLSRVKIMVEERQWSLNESNLRIMRDLEELKSQIRQLRSDKRETNKKLINLETENKYLRQMLTNILTSRPSNLVYYQNEAVMAQKNPNNTKRSQSLNLHYGTIHQTSNLANNTAGAMACLAMEEQFNEDLHIHESGGPSSISTTDIANLALSPDDIIKRSSICSSDSSLSSNESIEQQPKHLLNGISKKSSLGNVPSPPNFALISTPEEVSPGKENTEKKMEKTKVGKTDEMKVVNKSPKKPNEQELRKELKDAMLAKKDAEKRVIALERMVKNLHINARHPPVVSQNGSNNFSTNHYGVGSNTNTTTSTSSATAATTTSTSSTGTTITKNKSSPTNRGTFNAPTTASHLKQKNSNTLQQNPTSTANNHKKLKHQNHILHNSFSANSLEKTISPASSKLSVSGPITDL